MKNGKFANSHGDEIYFKDDKIHREDGPAIERTDGTKAWYFEGKLHREDGPALIYPNWIELYYNYDHFTGYGYTGKKMDMFPSTDIRYSNLLIYFNGGYLYDTLEEHLLLCLM